MTVYDFDQYSDSWWAARRGLPTGSQFGRIITPAKGSYSSSAKGYISELIAEELIPEFEPDRFESAAMAHGTETEDEARRLYAFAQGLDPEQVGFCVSDCERYGASPDALVGDDGALEIKCPLPKTHVDYLVGGKLPDAYKAQVHGHLLVTGRAWCDFVSYCDGLPLFVCRVTPDDFTEKLASALDRFCDELAETRAKIRGLAVEQGLIEAEAA